MGREAKVEEPDVLTEQDERLLDRAWKTIREWSPPARKETPPPKTVVFRGGRK